MIKLSTFHKNLTAKTAETAESRKAKRSRIEFVQYLSFLGALRALACPERVWFGGGSFFTMSLEPVRNFHHDLMLLSRVIVGVRLIDILIFQNREFASEIEDDVSQVDACT